MKLPLQSLTIHFNVANLSPSQITPSEEGDVLTDSKCIPIPGSGGGKVLMLTIKNDRLGFADKYLFPEDMDRDGICSCP